MLEGSPHFEASLARAVVLAVLVLAGLMGLTATAAYLWHVYRLIAMSV